MLTFMIVGISTDHLCDPFRESTKVRFRQQALGLAANIVPPSAGPDPFDDSLGGVTFHVGKYR